jgi:hypothetical protein
MMYPILCKVKYETLHRIFAHRQIWIQLGFSVVANWIIAPLLMVCCTERKPLFDYMLTRGSSDWLGPSCRIGLNCGTASYSWG